MTEPEPTRRWGHLGTDLPDTARAGAAPADAPHAAPVAPELVEPVEDEPARKPHSSTRSALEWIAVVAGALVVALVVKTFLIQAFYIPSGSMLPTLAVGDRVLVNKVSYDLHDVNRGDVIVFERPGGAGADGIKDLIKRVVGLPGEVVEGRDGSVYIDGERLDEPYLPDGTPTSQFGPVTVPDGELWVMGDNRTASDDSRRFGTIPEDSVVGRAFVVVWPIPELGTL